MTIDVTQEDLDSGEPESGFRCPLIRALNRVTGSTWLLAHNLVDYYVIREAPLPRGTYRLPQNARKWLTAEADFEAVAPFSFEFDPDAVVEVLY